MNKPIRIRIRLLIPAAAVALAVGAPAGAQADHSRPDAVLTCGQTITKSVKLEADLDCSSGESGGLLIGARNITVDLNDHTILGSGGADQFEGIENDGYNNVTIENGTVKRFQDDILLQNVAKNTVDHMHLGLNDPGSYIGIKSSYGSGNSFTDNRINWALYGIYSTSGSANKIQGNVLGNASTGVYTQSEAQDLVADNRSRGFSIATYAFWSQGDYGTTYTGDVANGGYEGFYATNPSAVTYDGVTANHNGYAGIYIENNDPGSGYSASVVNSTANSNDEYGMYSSFGIPSKDNTALHNDYYNCYFVSCNG